MFSIEGHVLTGNDEIPEFTDIIMRCPKANSESYIQWRLQFGSTQNINICGRSPDDQTCTKGQASQYQGRVTRDNSGGPGSERYSIKISRVLASESGTYSCINLLDELEKYNNVRVIRKLDLNIDKFWYIIKFKLKLF